MPHQEIGIYRHRLHWLRLSQPALSNPLAPPFAGRLEIGQESKKNSQPGDKAGCEKIYLQQISASIDGKVGTFLWTGRY